MHAKARREGIIVKEIKGEFVLYDEKALRAHELNTAAGVVWQHCDGETSIRDLADAMAAETELPADEDIVHLALAQLAKAGLLEGPQQGFEPRISRRQLIQRLSLASSLTVLLPMVGTIVAPSSAMAQSGPGSPYAAFVFDRLPHGFADRLPHGFADGCANFAATELG